MAAGTRFERASERYRPPSLPAYPIRVTFRRVDPRRVEDAPDVPPPPVHEAWIAVFNRRLKEARPPLANPGR